MINYVVCNYVCPDNVKITRKKKLSKLFSCDGHGVVKCHRNLNFEKMDTAS